LKSAGDGSLNAVRVAPPKTESWVLTRTLGGKSLVPSATKWPCLIFFPLNSAWFRRAVCALEHQPRRWLDSELADVIFDSLANPKDKELLEEFRGERKDNAIHASIHAGNSDVK
jgi:hypothetical protein